MILQVIIFLVSIFIMSWLSSSLIKTLVALARYLRWREFIIAFFVMGCAASLPNLFIDLPAALQGLAPLAFGDIIGGNLIDLTLILAIVVLFSKKDLSTDSRMVQGSSIFTFFIAILPIFLIWTGKVTRLDGVILIVAYGVYVYWLFSNNKRFKKAYRETKKDLSVAPPQRFIVFLKNILKLIVLIAVLLVASQGVIASAKYFSESWGISLSLVGILIVALANCFPEAYFGIISARNGEGWMTVGDIMGSVVTAATLILGIIALVSPFEIGDMSPFLMARIFTVIAAAFFLVVVKTDKKISKKEAIFLLSIYLIFLIVEIFMHK